MPERCRNWIDSKFDRCGAPADCIVWGKLLPPDTLGPRCYPCAEAHFGYRNVHDRDGRGYAIYHLPEGAKFDPVGRGLDVSRSEGGA